MALEICERCGHGAARHYSGNSVERDQRGGNYCAAFDCGCRGFRPVAEGDANPTQNQVGRDARSSPSPASASLVIRVLSLDFAESRMVADAIRATVTAAGRKALVIPGACQRDYLLSLGATAVPVVVINNKIVWQGEPPTALRIDRPGPRSGRGESTGEP